MSLTCSSINTYATGSVVVSDRFNSIECLLDGLKDNTTNSITAKNVRDAVFTLWERVEEIQLESGTLFENNEPTTERLGGIPEGVSFAPTNMQDMWNRLLYDEIPEVTNPFVTATSSLNGLVELGQYNLQITSTFDRGLIEPQYASDSPFRSGLPIKYEYNGNGGINQTSTSSSLTDLVTINNYSISPGTQSVSIRVQHSAGIQPKTKLGNDYLSALSTAFTKFFVLHFHGTLAIYATSEDINTLTKQTLYKTGQEFYEIELVADSNDNLNKQTFRFPVGNGFGNITGIQQYSSFTNTWDWIFSNKVDSLTSFTITGQLFLDTSGNIDNISGYAYREYVYNGPKIGSRKIRLYTN